MTTRRFRAFFLFLLALWLAACRSGSQPGAGPEEFLPDAKSVRRVVSLSSPASEILAAIGAADAVTGICIPDSNLPGLASKPLVGSAAAPDTARIIALRPDIVLAAPHQSEVARILRAKGVAVLMVEEGGTAAARKNIRTLGVLAGREREAEALIAGQEASVTLARAKVAKLAEKPGHTPLRAIRLLGVDNGALRVPGDDAVANEIIRMAGGDAPVFGQNGGDVAVTPDMWRSFDPDVVILCGQESAAIRQRLQDPAWTWLRATAARKTVSYPCELVDRAAARYGYAALRLSSDLYGASYSDPATQVSEDAALARKPLNLPFAFVTGAEVIESRLFDMPAKTLVVRFTRPQEILSTLSGWQNGVRAVGNHYASPPAWPITHHLGLKTTNSRTLALLGLFPQTSAMLYTGADMGNLAYAEETANGLRIGVFATAGVSGNAMRASVDTGHYVEPGTINIIVMTNRALTRAAMARALITATEAKTAVLEDLDIRSSYTGTPATGTGTDNVIVIAGAGSSATMTGGHTKLGELTAKAVYTAVREAVARQNHIRANRNIFQRLNERGLALEALLPNVHLEAAALEHLLLEPRYAGFLASALALSDSYERGLIPDTSAFSAACLAMAQEIAGVKVTAISPMIAENKAPRLVREAVNALATGLLQRQNR